jgi:hypothetical protein
MTQLDVKDYLLLEEHCCYVYDTRNKDNGVYYFIRNRNTKKLVVVYPVKNGTYTPGAVCHICNQLNVPVPEYGKRMQGAIDEAKEKAKDIPIDREVIFKDSQRKKIEKAGELGE